MRNLHEIRRRLRKREKSAEPWPARVGDASGTIEVPGNPGLWYVRPEGSDLPIIVHRGSAPKIRDYPVWVGSDLYKKRVKRILGVNATSFSAGTGAGGSSPAPLEPHAASHFETGWDVVYVSTAQVVDALCYISGGMNVTINPGWAIIGGKPTRIEGTTIDMTSHIPTGGARWALVRVDDTGTVSVQDGSTVSSFADLTAADVPQLAVGYAALAAVRLYAGQTALSNLTEGRDLIDLRLSPSDGRGGGLSNAIALYGENTLRGVYEASYAGLSAAIGDAQTGDTILLPPGDYSGNISIPDGVTIAGQTRDTTRLLGTVTTQGDAIIQNLRIEKVTPDAQTEKALVINGANKTASLVGVSVIASVPQSGTCYAISIEAASAVVQARQCYIAGTYNQTTLVYFSGATGQTAKMRFCYLDGNNPTNDATRLYTYACQFHADAATYGTPEVGDRASYDHNHEGFDADKLDGQHGSYYQDASNINAGTLSTDRFSAYNDLVAESKIGTGSNQVAPGQHALSAHTAATSNIDFAGYKAIAMACDNGATFPANPTEGQWFLHTPTGRKWLYQYVGGSWRPIYAMGRSDIYWSNSGTDNLAYGTGPGSSAFRTLNYIWSAIPPTFGGDIYIMCGSETYTGSSNLGLTLYGKIPGGSYTIYFQGVNGGVTADSGTITGFVQANGATRCTITDTTKSWTANQFRGYFVTVGGIQRVIQSNSSNTLTIVGNLSGLSIGASYTIWTPSTIWDGETVRNYVVFTNAQQAIQFNYIEFRNHPSNGINVSRSSAIVINSCRFIGSPTATASGTAAIVADYSAIAAIYSSYFQIATSGVYGIRPNTSSAVSAYYCYLYSNAGTKIGYGISALGGFIGFFSGSVAENFYTAIYIIQATVASFYSTTSLGYDLIQDCTYGVYSQVGSSILTSYDTLQYSGCTVNLYTASINQDITVTGGLRNAVQLQVNGNTSQTNHLVAAYDSTSQVLAAINYRGGLIVNEQGLDTDTRIEGDTDQNLIFVDASVDRVGIGTSTPTAKLDINSDIIRLRTSKTPASATDSGNAGDICWDSNYLYICVATNTWKRVALSSW